jgi:hypothetical protein
LKVGSSCLSISPVHLIPSPMIDGINVQSIALVLSLIDLGFPSALVGAVEDHRTAAPTFACSVGLSEDKVVIALLDIVLGMSRCMT